MPTAATIERPMKAKKKPTVVKITAKSLMRPDTSTNPLSGNEYNGGKPLTIRPAALPEGMAERLLALPSLPEPVLSASPVGMTEMSRYLAAMSDNQLRRGFKVCVIEATTHDMEEMGILGTDKARGFLTGLLRCLEVFHQRFVRLDPPVGVRGVGRERTRRKR